MGCGPMVWVYIEHALPCATPNKMDNVSVHVKDSKGKVVVLTVTKEIAERMKNGKYTEQL